MVVCFLFFCAFGRSGLCCSCVHVSVCVCVRAHVCVCVCGLCVFVLRCFQDTDGDCMEMRAEREQPRNEQIEVITRGDTSLLLWQSYSPCFIIFCGCRISCLVLQWNCSFTDLAHIQFHSIRFYGSSRTHRTLIRTSRPECTPVQTAIADA